MPSRRSGAVDPTITTRWTCARPIDLVDHGAELAYRASGAVMITSLVAGSAWINPPFDGPHLGWNAHVDCCDHRRCRRCLRRRLLRRREPTLLYGDASELPVPPRRSTAVRSA